MSGGYAPSDFASSLRKIEASQLDYFVEGGQAVNIRAEVYSAAAPEVTEFAPLTSKDCDLWVGRDLQAVRAGSPGWQAEQGIGPGSGPARHLHHQRSTTPGHRPLDGVYGLSRDEVNRAKERSLVVDGIRLIDPLLLLKAKCHNLAKLPNQGERNDAKHLGIKPPPNVPAKHTEFIDHLLKNNLSEEDLHKAIVALTIDLSSGRYPQAQQSLPTA